MGYRSSRIIHGVNVTLHDGDDSWECFDGLIEGGQRRKGRAHSMAEFILGVRVWSHMIHRYMPQANSTKRRNLIAQLFNNKSRFFQHNISHHL